MPNIQNLPPDSPISNVAGAAAAFCSQIRHAKYHVVITTGTGFSVCKKAPSSNEAQNVVTMNVAATRNNETTSWQHGDIAAATALFGTTPDRVEVKVFSECHAATRGDGTSGKIMPICTARPRYSADEVARREYPGDQRGDEGSAAGGCGTDIVSRRADAKRRNLFEPALSGHSIARVRYSDAPVH